MRTFGGNRVSRLGNFLFGRESFSVVVEQSAPELIARIQSAITSAQAGPRFGAPAFRGDVSESGFVLRPVAAHPKDTRASVVARGELEPSVGATRVHVTVRHSRAMVFFGWLLALLASADAVATTQFVDSRNLTMAVVLAAFAILWHVLLWRNIRRVESDIKALLSRT
jgi:hypothetical protein